jgi:formate hydrogenlyase transcriptional activator
MSATPPDSDPEYVSDEAVLQQIATTLLTSTTDGILVVGADGLIVFCNHSAETMFGYPSGGLRLQRVEQLLPKRLRGEHPQHRGGFQSHPTPRMMGARKALPALRGDGSEFFVAIALVPLDLDGRGLVCAQVRDVTWRVEQERQLEASLAELQEIKGQTDVENLMLREELDSVHGFEEIVGKSSALLRVLAQVETVAPTDATVLITGETGTGKDLIARAIHRHGGRREKLFLSVNCASLPTSLLESELFGHEKGAFTGATSQRIGRFEQADGGTLFMDEIGEMPLEAQAKLLHVLQNGEFERVGSTRSRKTDVRVVAATNKDLELEVSEGRFRRDLYHRLAVFPLHLPSLRERREDIPLLTSYLAARKTRRLGRVIERIPLEVIDRLMIYDWPGNVRELENVLERAIILSPGATLRTEAIHLGPNTIETRHGGDSPQRVAVRAEWGADLQANERAHILHVCEACAWKIKGPGGAAQKLGLNPATLYSRLKKLGIKRP